MEIKGYAVNTQYDCDPKRPQISDHSPPEGPLLHETYLEKAGSLDQAKARAAQLRNKFGWALVAYVSADTDSYYNKQESAK